MAEQETTPGTATSGPVPRTAPAVASLGSGDIEAEIVALTRRLAGVGERHRPVHRSQPDSRLSGDAEFPRLDAAMACGDMSYAKARVLAAHLDHADTAGLIAIAQRTHAGRLGAAIAAWSQQHQEPEEIRTRQHQARSCTWRCDPDGMITLTARMAPRVAARSAR